MSIFYILIFLLFVGLGTYLGYRYYKDTLLIKTSKFVENDEFKKKNTSKYADLFLFYTNWCPHCKNTLKIWDTLYALEPEHNLKMNYIKVDCEKEKNLATSYDIKEYPTIILEKDGKKIVFDAELSEASFLKFMKAVNNM